VSRLLFIVGDLAWAATAVLVQGHPRARTGSAR